MNLRNYSGIIFAITFVPAFIVFTIGLISWLFCRKSECLMLIIMKGIISRKNINKKRTYLICNRALPSSSRRHFMLNSLFVIAICVQCFFLIAIVDVTYNCNNEPDLDCFKKKDDVKLSDTFAYDESPVNCSTISNDDFVICYRISAFDPERVFVAAAAGYLLFKMLSFGLFIVAHMMLWFAQKSKKRTLLLFKIGFSLFFTVVLYIPLILRIYVDDVESAFRKMSYTLLIQFGILLIVIIHFVARLPWEKFCESAEYYGDASLPDNVDAYGNEMN